MASTSIPAPTARVYHEASRPVRRRTTSRAGGRMLALWIAACGHRESPPPAPGGVVVLVSVDQLPTRQLALVRPLLAPDGGFARLTGEAAFHAGAAHTHAVTQTCPGHATLVTGASPAIHGIVGNRWIDPAGKTVYCADPDGDGAPDP